MKNLLLIFMAFATFVMNGQDKTTSNKETQRDESTQLTPEQRADLKVKRLTLTLDLTEAQQQKAKQIFLKNDIKRAERPKNWKEMSASQKYEAKSANIDRQIALKNEMKEILTEEQIAKWEQQKLEKRARTGAKHRQGKKGRY